MSIFAAQRTDSFSESVIREMTRLAHEHDAINLAQGFPDFPCPDIVKEAARDAIEADLNQYSITWGTTRLRKQVAKTFQRRTGIEVDPAREVVITCGATEAMAASLLALVNPGEEVILFEPFYENYGPDIAMAGAKARVVRLREPDFHLDEAELRGAFGYNTKAIIINTPHNPTGKVFTERELSIIGRLCREWDVLAITDEVYEYLLADDQRHISMATLPGTYELTVTINSLSKTYCATGWRVGWAVAAPELMDPIRKVHDFLTVAAPTPLQDAAVEALRMPATYQEELRRMIVARREIMLKGLAAAGFRPLPPNGTYYILADISSFGMDDITFSTYLAKELGVACVPGSSFYHHSAHGKSLVRFAFGKREETLLAACQRLAELKERL